jgi:hypothetical protein
MVLFVYSLRSSVDELAVGIGFKKQIDGGSAKGCQEPFIEKREGFGYP